MHILFVCTGNTCRSAMAECYVTSLKNPELTAESAGFSFAGDPANPKAVTVMREIGADLSGHRSRVVTLPLCQAADRIFCMSTSHQSALLSAGVPGEKITLLDGGIADPYGLDLSAYRRCRDQLISAINREFSLRFDPIFRCGPEDAPAIAALESQCFADPWSEDSVLSALSAGTVFFGCKKGGELIGYCGVRCVAGQGDLMNVAVAPSFRRQGIARRLMSCCVALALKESLSFLTLEVRAGNREAIRLYESFGFKKEGTRKDFYAHPQEDALIYTLRFEEETPLC